MIESLQNNTVKLINKLKQKKYRYQYQQFIIEGDHLVKEALQANIVDKILIVQDSKYHYDFNNIEIVTRKVMDYLCDTQSNSEVLAICNMINNNIDSDFICVLNQVQDPGNMGTILRSAYSFGFNKVICVNCVDIYNDKTIRSSQGALYHINIVLENDIFKVINDLKDINYQVIGTTLHHSNYLQQANINNKVAIVMGNEGSGLSEEVVKQCDSNIKIEMAAFESLNVAVASSILMYQIYIKKEA